MDTNEQQNGERMFFVCGHVKEKTRGIGGFGTNVKWKQGEVGEILCSRCFSNGLDERGEREGARFTEAEAVKRGWIPKSRSMQYLLSVSDDQTGGQAVDSRESLLFRRLHFSGLTEEKQSFLYHLFMRGKGSGMEALTENEEEMAAQLTMQMFKGTEEEQAQRVQQQVQRDQVEFIKADIHQQEPFFGELIDQATRWEIAHRNVRIFFSTENRALAETLQQRVLSPLERLSIIAGKTLGENVRVHICVENSDQKNLG